MPSLPLFQVDAFTSERFTGNPAGVVLDADDLTGRDMQRIARELNNSETAFVLKPDAPDHELRIRYFTPTMEVPSCGHATISAHYVRARVQSLSSGRVWHKIGIGRLPVDIELVDDDYAIVMTHGSPVIDEALPSSAKAPLLSALGLTADDLEPDLPVQRIDTGNNKYLVPLKSRSRLNALTPDLEALRAFDRDFPNRGIFAFTLQDTDQDVAAHARMFAPQIGIPEDPVTGNGNGPLGAYLVRHGVMEANAGSVHFRVRQGEAMGRPGVAHVWVECDGVTPLAVRVGGRAVIAFSATLDL